MTSYITEQIYLFQKYEKPNIATWTATKSFKSHQAAIYLYNSILAYIDSPGWINFWFQNIIYYSYIKSQETVFIKKQKKYAIYIVLEKLHEKCFTTIDNTIS